VIRLAPENIDMIARYVRPLLAGAAIVLTAAAVAVAQDDGSLIEQLSLTPAQKDQIKRLREQFKTETEPIRSSLTQLQKEVRQLKAANPVNESSLRAKLKQQADKEIELSLAITRFQERVEALLTADQKRLLKKLQDAR